MNSNTMTMRTRTRQVDGLTIRYADTDAANGPDIPLTSPWPESLLAFRRIWPALATGARLIAVDLPGFGHSEGRTDLFTPGAMAEFLVQLIGEFGLGSPHLVAPDVGTSAALFLAARHPGKVTSLVVGGGGSAYPLDVTGTLADIIAAPDIEAFRTIDIRATIGATVEPVAPPRPGARGLGRPRQLLRERPVRRVSPLRPQLPRTAAGAAEPAACSANPSTHRQRRPRPPRATRQWPLPR
ncbi:MAG TPA: alpha/beta fold hydrolase [Streptosporangiaceae bacterium]